MITPSCIIGKSTSAEALNHWIGHCEDSIVKFSKEVEHYQSVPLPLSRVNDMLVSLRSLSALIGALKTKHKGDGTLYLVTL